MSRFEQTQSSCASVSGVRLITARTPFTSTQQQDVTTQMAVFQRYLRFGQRRPLAFLGIATPPQL